MTKDIDRGLVFVRLTAPVFAQSMARPAPRPERRRPRGAVLLAWALLAGPWPCSAAAEPLRSAAEVRAVGSWNPRAVYPLRLEGTLTWVDREKRLIVLQDATGAVALQLDRVETSTRPGHRISLEADNSLPLLHHASTFPFQPTRVALVPLAEEPTDRDAYFASRLRGYLHPPATGDYRFWIAADDMGELWLGTNESPASARRIALAAAFTNPREWNKRSGQKSDLVRLEGGRRYYFETVHMEIGGRDNLAVSWEGPELPQQVIEGRHLSPWPDRPGGPPAERGGLRFEEWSPESAESPAVLTSPRRLETALVAEGVRIRDLGAASFPDPVAVQPGQPVGEDLDFRWCEMTGDVDFISRQGDRVVLELADGAPRTRVVVSSWPAAPDDASDPRYRRRVRVQGVVIAAPDLEGHRVAATVVMPPGVAPVAVEQRPRLDAFEATTISDLQAGPAQPDRPVRLRGRVTAVGPPDRLTLSDLGTFQGFTSADGRNWRPLGEPVELPMADAIQAGLVVSSNSAENSATAVFEHVRGLEGEFVSTAVGDPQRTGRHVAAGDRHTLTGSGHDIWISPDQFYFAHRTLDGGGEIVARLAAFSAHESWPKAGLMMRESTAADAAFVDIVQSGNHGCLLQWRQAGAASLPQSAILPGLQPPVWLKLTRRFHRIEVAGAFDVRPAVGTLVEVAGIARHADGAVSLVDASWRELAADGSASAFESSSRPVVELARMRGGGANPTRQEMTKIRGVVTFAGWVAGRRYLAIQDRSDATFLSEWSPGVPWVQAGDLIEVHRNPSDADDTPRLRAGHVVIIGAGALPTPVRHPAQYALPHRGEARWVEAEGVVRAVAAAGELRLRAGADDFRVHVGGADASGLRQHVGATLRVRGVLTYPSPQERLLLVPSLEHVEAVESAPKDPFSIRLASLADLAGRAAPSPLARQVRVRAVVTHAAGGHIYVQDATGGARVEPGASAIPQPGELVEIVGFPDRAEDQSPVLAQAMLRAVGAAQAPLPAIVAASDLLSGQYGAKLVRLRANFSRSRSEDDSHTLELQLDQRIFRASLTAPGLPSIPPGSLLELTGVAVVETGLPEWIRVSAGTSSVLPVRLLLRSPDDIQVIEKPPGWAVRRTLLFAGTAAGGLIAAGIWIHLLRRRVAQRTTELRAAMEKLQRETQAAATLAERNRLAGEIHDSIEQGFSALIFQLDSTAKQTACPPEVRSGLAMARNMVAFSRNEVRHAVWDLQSPIFAEADLGTALQRIVMATALDALHTTVAVEGTPRPLGQEVEHHLLRIGQEAVANTVKHAHARTLEVVLDFAPSRVRLIVRDDGCGFEPDRVFADGVGHFGLRSLRSRARKIHASLDVSSSPGHGTRVVVEVPAS